jgi:hypothetical protein
MKNIHVIPTDKSGRVGRFVDTQELILRSGKDIPRGENVNIYITNDEVIKEGDKWVYNTHWNEPQKIEEDWVLKILNESSNTFKIILTTDPELIKDGVQAIDDTFLKWFVNNPDCEEVEVIYGLDITDGMSVFIFSYQIIIPKEEEFCHYSGLPSPLAYIEKPIKREPYWDLVDKKAEQNNSIDLDAYASGVMDGAKWQAERMYSEEEVLEQLNLLYGMKNSTVDTFTDKNDQITKRWFEQFKKK